MCTVVRIFASMRRYIRSQNSMKMLKFLNPNKQWFVKSGRVLIDGADSIELDGCERSLLRRRATSSLVLSYLSCYKVATRCHRFHFSKFFLLVGKLLCFGSNRAALGRVQAGSHVNFLQWSAPILPGRSHPVHRKPFKAY